MGAGSIAGHGDEFVRPTGPLRLGARSPLTPWALAKLLSSDNGGARSPCTVIGLETSPMQMTASPIAQGGELATLSGLAGFLEAATLAELPRLVDQQTLYYNRERRHSPVDNQPPLAYLESEGIPA